MLLPSSMYSQHKDICSTLNVWPVLAGDEIDKIKSVDHRCIHIATNERWTGRF